MATMDNPVLSFIRALLVEPSKVNDAVAFYRTAFNAQEVTPVPPFAAAQLNIAGTHYLIIHLPSNFSNDGEDKMISTLGSSSIMATVQWAMRAGAVQEPVEEHITAMYGGGPIAKIRDPFGFSWYICKTTSLPQFM